MRPFLTQIDLWLVWTDCRPSQPTGLAVFTSHRQDSPNIAPSGSRISARREGDLDLSSI